MRKFLTMCLGLAILAMAIPAQVFAQSKYEVKGVVVDTTGTPVIGASVIEQGTTNGVTTDVNGQYVLRVSSSESVVVISFIGYKTQSLVASSNLLSNVVLEEDSEMIDDVVVIGYGVAKKDDLTGSVVAVKADDLNRGAVVSTQDMMQGKVPGLQVIPGDGGPNSAPKMRIRGISSLNANQNPLVVIDGVPIASDMGGGMTNPLSLVNPNDIESFSVLKDASAAAIYGSRASNGVIIITTKKGKGNKINVSYNGSFSVQQNSATLPVMSADEFRGYIKDVYGDELSQHLGEHNTDWQSLIFRTALSHDHNASLYGNYRDEKGVVELPYRVSLGYTGQQGTLHTAKYDRVTLDFNLAPKFLDNHLTVSVSGKGVYSHERNASSGAVSEAAFFNPTMPAYNYDKNGEIDYLKTNGYFQYGSWTGSGLFIPTSQSPNNPLSTLYDNENTKNAYRFLGNAQIDYKVHGFEALRFNLNLGTDYVKSNSKNMTMPGSRDAWNDSEAIGWGRYSEGFGKNYNNLLEFIGNFNETWGKHTLDATLGYSWQHVYGGGNSYGYFNKTGEAIPQHDTTFRAEESFIVSFFGRVNYSFDSRYLFTFSLRADGSSKFAKDNRWGYFPSAAFAWNAKNESFLEDVDAVSALKLRLSYGETGQQEIGNYMYLAGYSESTDNYNMAYMGSNGYYYYYTPKAYDPNIKWETTVTYNIGVDFGFLDGMINGSIDVYRRDTKDLLNSVITPLGANFGDTIMTNIGTMRNQGVEFSLDFNPVRTQDWSLRFGFNGTFQDTEFVQLDNNTGSSDYAIYMGGPSRGTGGAGMVMHKEGCKPYTFYTFRQVYDSNGKPIQNALWDKNGDGILGQDDRYNTGKSPLPDFFFGLNLKLNYRNWDFGFNGHGSIGNYAFNDIWSTNSTSNININSGTIGNYLKLTGKNATGWTGANSQEQWASDLFLEDASFFRLDDINLGYTFDKLGNTGLKMRIAVGVQNVFVITKYSGLDPEVSSDLGIDGTIWPRPRTYSLRLNLNF
ncbi:MAG: TonB-dependent receptor [Alistipes sp.]|nr:TonB-dependent receptor [Alistipes sp.]